MNILPYIPSPSLQPFIKRYLIIESEDEITNRILPNTSLAIAFRYKGEVSYVNDDGNDKLPAVTISGLRKSARLIHYNSHTANLIVLFTETGASAFFRESLYELFEDSIPLSQFAASPKIGEIEERLAEAATHQQRIAVIEQFFLSIQMGEKQDQLILSALQTIRKTNGNTRMKVLARSLCTSQDAFEKRFRKIVGTSPKQFASITRLQSIINQRESPQSLAHRAFEAGYYDQAHFSKDFRLFTGRTPADFFASSQPFW